MTDLGASFITGITLQGFLSFDPVAPEIPLSNLNVIIGPNGSGKSNFIEALSVLRAVPRDLPLPTRQGGGVGEWLWKDPRGTQAARASIELLFAKGAMTRDAARAASLRYQLTFGAKGDAFEVLDERIENQEPAPGTSKPYFYFGYENGRPMLNVDNGHRELRRETSTRRSSYCRSAATRVYAGRRPGIRHNECGES